MESGGKGHTNGFAPIAIARAERGTSGSARVTRRDGDSLVGVFG
jgi:hypothetical protein